MKELCDYGRPCGEEVYEDETNPEATLIKRINTLQLACVAAEKQRAELQERLCLLERIIGNQVQTR